MRLFILNSFTFFVVIFWITNPAFFTLIRKCVKLCLLPSLGSCQDILALEEVILEMVRLVGFSGTKPVQKLKTF